MRSKLCPNLDRSPFPNIISSEIKALLYYNQYISYMHSGGGGGYVEQKEKEEEEEEQRVKQ